MKTYSKILLAAAVAASALSACSREPLEPASAPKGNLVEVHFGAESKITAPTRATLTTEDETTFKSAWTNGDALSVEYMQMNAEATGTVSATWNGSSFDASLPEGTDEWSYDAVYPAPGSDGKTDFGSARTQNGNAYNSKYDLMKGSVVTKNAAAGKTDDGKDIVFPMDRQTAIAYFHLTGSLDEDLVSAKLSVEGGSIATSSAALSSYSKGYVLSTDDANALSEITLTFDEGTAPKASDCQLWFNVLPTEYTKMTLTVETASHTLTISRTPSSGTDAYVAGNLYKVVKEISADAWTEKASAEPLDLIFDFVTSPTGWPTSKSNSKEGSYNYTLGDVTYTFTHSKTKDGIYCGGTSSARYLMVNKGEKLGLPALSGYKLTKVVGTLNTEGASKSSVVSITDGDAEISGGEGQNWSTYGESYTYNLPNTDEGVGYYLVVSSAANCQIIKLALTYEPAAILPLLSTPEDLAVSSDKKVSWTAVNGAASYKVTIGENTFDAATNSYDASDIEDEYYDVTVIAIPADVDSYKNSAAATLSSAKFGTPTLSTPALKEGAVDETSVATTWTVDARATEGYNCEIYNGETKVSSQTVTAGSVTFSSLSSGVTYTVKVNAIAVSGDKAYAASAVASVSVTTKAANHVSDVTAAGTYTIKNLTVYAVPSTSNAIIGDGTGYLLLYKSSHGLAIGNTLDVAGSIVEYNGVWEYNSPTISNKATGTTPTYSGAVEATESWLTSYAEASSVQYIHAKGTQSARYISVGSQKLYLSEANSDTDGQGVEVYGFVYGYKSSSASFVATSIKVDNTIPTLSIDKDSKTWTGTETDAFVIKVTVNSEGGDWNVTPTTLDWATVAVDKTAGTITVTPNGENSTSAAYESTLTVTHASDASLTKTITLKQNAASALKEYTATITASTLDGVGSSSSGYAKYDGTQTVTAAATDGTTISMKFTTSNVMPQSDKIQFKKNSGKLSGTGWGTVQSVTTDDTSLTVSYDSGDFSVSASSSTGKATSVVIVFKM